MVEHEGFLDDSLAKSVARSSGLLLDPLAAAKAKVHGSPANAYEAFLAARPVHRWSLNSFLVTAVLAQLGLQPRQADDHRDVQRCSRPPGWFGSGCRDVR